MSRQTTGLMLIAAATFLALPALTQPTAAAKPAWRGLYVNAWAFGSSRLDGLLRIVRGTEINALVIDVKDDTGYLTYRSTVPTAIAIGANRALRAKDVAQRLARIKASGLRPVARIVVAKDPLLAERRPAWAIHRQGGGLWTDRKGHPWVDAFTDSVWIYAAQLGREAAAIGFEEIQFDYVRFPDEPKSRMATASFPGRRAGETTRDGVARNLKLVADRTRATGVEFTIDVFGLTTTAIDDMGIGQLWEDLVTTADVVLPMVYPSHYRRGVYGVHRPNGSPYLMVKRALEDGRRRSARITGAKTAEIRPYLQAFTLGAPRYTPWHVREQIRAVEETGIHSWVLWNPGSRYDPAVFRRDAAPISAPAGSAPGADPPRQD